jgi:MinD-like ATPase involved in chromosome partitioning or flagellar assembly
VDRTEATDRAEPTPRWRSLLDRARLANRTGSDEFADGPPDDSRRSADPSGDQAHQSGPGDNRRAADRPGRSAVEGRSRARDRVIDPSRAANQDGADGQPWAPPGPRQRGADAGVSGPPAGGGGLFEPVSSNRQREPSGDRGYREPVGGGGLFDPVSGGGYREPVSGGGGLFEPVSGGGYREPVSGGAVDEQSHIGRASGPGRNGRPHDPAANGANPAPRQPARGSARGPVAGRATPPAAGTATPPGGALAPSTYTGTGYIPAPATQPTMYGSSPTRAVGAPRIGIPPQPTRGRGRMSGRVEWQAPPTSAGVDEIVAALRRDLGGSKVIAFANPKGGVHKTTATVLAAATIGGIRGRGVLAWDDNELRGTLGLRAGSARHARTIRHLVNDLDDVVSYHGDELLDRLDNYLRHASDGSYDVLAGEENPRFGRQLDPYTVRRVLELLRRTHDVICVDTGNNVESSNWQTILQMADQLVITTVPREDAAFTADWMLDLLYETGLGDLAANAVTLLSCPTPNPSNLLQDLATHFATRTRAVAVVPYDPMLETGSSIEHTELAPATRRAWLQAAGVMIEPFVR